MLDRRLKFGILAYPAEHSLSPVMFEAAFKAAGIENASYEVFEVAPSELEGFMRARARDLDGLSVSLPYKEAVVRFLDEVEDDAKKIGAVNTISRVQGGSRDSTEGQLEAGTRRGTVRGTLRGFNTDWSGAVEALKEVGDVLRDKRVVILGAGGAARAITYGLLKEKAEVVVLNRSLEKAKRLGKDFGVKVGLLSDVAEYECDILVQATSVWITSGLDAKVVPDSYIWELGARGGIVMDIIYKPLMTPLLEVAREAGCRIVTGDKMLLNQAVRQFEIWFGEEGARLGGDHIKDRVREAMRRALRDNIAVD